MMSKKFTKTEISEIIEMALSDDIPFKVIEKTHGINADQIKRIMRQNISASSYETWRKRVKLFSTRRKHYK